jgi:7-carboxy-7-deazaguanine synthase
MSLRVSEVYKSVQGEGPRVGRPTVFVRFGGCNLRCPGWPCDTPHAIFPKEFRDTWIKKDPVDLAGEISAVAGPTSTTICYTGGEPFLQRNNELEILSDWLWEMGFARQEVFTNGTLLFPDWAIGRLDFIMDWKLPGSGEDPDDDNRIANVKRLTHRDAVKFVIKDRDDFDHAIALYRARIVPLGSLLPRVYYGAVWGKIKSAQLVEWVLEEDLPWTLNIQTHNIIWPPHERGR